MAGSSRGGRPKATMVWLRLTRLTLGGGRSTQIGLLPSPINDVVAWAGAREVRRPKKVVGSSSPTTKRRKGKKSRGERKGKKREKKERREEREEKKSFWIFKTRIYTF